jgi:hypothetical protein
MGSVDRFNGKVFVTGIQHLYTDRNYYTEIQFGWNQEWFYKTDDIIERPAAGLVPGNKRFTYRCGYTTGKRSR